MDILNALSVSTSDFILFFVLQILLMLFCVIAALREAQVRVRPSGRSVIRGQESMGLFYGVYGVISGLLVAIALSVEVARDHRIFWAAVDTLLVAYLCLVNTWSRNHVLGVASRLRDRIKSLEEEE